MLEKKTESGLIIPATAEQPVKNETKTNEKSLDQLHYEEVKEGIQVRGQNILVELIDPVTNKTAAGVISLAGKKPSENVAQIVSIGNDVVDLEVGDVVFLQLPDEELKHRTFVHFTGAHEDYDEVCLYRLILLYAHEINIVLKK